MRQQFEGKLNWLQHHLPEGLVVDAAWLEKQGYSSALRSKYATRGWLDQVVRGVYRRPPAQLRATEDEGLRWQHVVISLQTLLERALIVGGRTALEQQGFAHYLSTSGPQEVHLYGNEPPPGWVRRLRVDTRFVFHNAKTLFGNESIAPGFGAIRNEKAHDPDGVDLLQSGLVRQRWGHWEWPLTLSTPERAILELLDEIPQRETFHQADMLMEGLRNLSPRRLHELLVDCRSVKVKRLFLWFAERHNHAWLKQLDRKDIDLGHGKRMLARGGKLDPKFNITVPESSMPAAELYRRQVALLIKVIPLVAAETCFALKGGTAINLFVRDMPRLSVDIDLTYLPVADRASSLKGIDAAMGRIGDEIARGIPGARVSPSTLQGEACITKLIVRADGVQMKIEVTPVLRGCVYEPEMRTVSPRVEDEFGFAEIQVVSFPDLYAGKLVAALDRQHPRDLFDVRDLLANEGIGDRLRKAFIVYLLSHNRPFAEVLDPARLDISQEFLRGFNGMTDTPVTVDELIRAREELIIDIVGRMPADHRRFLLSIKGGEPDWALLGLPGVEALPAVRWRLENLAKLGEAKRTAMIARLREVLKTED